MTEKPIYTFHIKEISIMHLHILCLCCDLMNWISKWPWFIHL